MVICSIFKKDLINFRSFRILFPINMAVAKLELIFSDHSRQWNRQSVRLPPNSIATTSNPTLKSIQNLVRRNFGVHSTILMAASGLHYTGEGDKAKCDQCAIEISNWTQNMHPFQVHATRSPNCPYVLQLKEVPSNSNSSVNSALRPTTSTNEAENPSKRQKTETTSNVEPVVNNLYETALLEQVRRRTFSHWPHRTIPSSSQMIEAGFFNCNVGDRVICIYCNLICQQWTPHTDDPCEVHKTLSPNCIYVKSKLIRPAASSIIIVNESATSATTNGNQSSASINLEPLRSHEIVFTSACNPAYTELPRRHASFELWPKEELPAVEDLVRAGFFYTGSKTIVTCFYCNGSLQNWGPNDNPMIEHARWFPHCPYAKQLCGDDLYRKIQESKRAQQERARANENREQGGGSASGSSNSTLPSTNQKLLIPDESTLSRLVAARLDLPISQRLLSLNFKLSIIKRCWEDQLRLKHDDFISDCDLFIACTILQKQIEHIDGKKENITIPSVRMKQIRERNEASRQNPSSDSCSITNTQTTDVDMTTSQSSTTESSSSIESNSKTSLPRPPSSLKTTPATQIINSSTSNRNGKTIDTKSNSSANSTDDSSTNMCVLCWSEEKRLACIPCGHLATCVPCGHSLRSCPICRREIEAFVRIYM